MMHAHSISLKNAIVTAPLGRHGCSHGVRITGVALQNMWRATTDWKRFSDERLGYCDVQRGSGAEKCERRLKWCEWTAFVLHGIQHIGKLRIGDSRNRQRARRRQGGNHHNKCRYSGYGHGWAYCHVCRSDDFYDWRHGVDVHRSWDHDVERFCGCAYTKRG